MTVMENWLKPQAPRVCPQLVTDGAIMAFWRLKIDTREIARQTWLRESEVANRLARLRDAGAL